MKALKDAENLAAIGRALSSVAHDMKTPLVAIGGFTSKKQVQRHLGPQDPYRVKTEIILKETERLEKMVEDMLDFSKPVELRKSFEQIGPLLAESVEVTKPLADAKDIELSLEAIDPVVGLQLYPDANQAGFDQSADQCHRGFTRGATGKDSPSQAGQRPGCRCQRQRPGHSLRNPKRYLFAVFYHQKRRHGPGASYCKKPSKRTKEASKS